MTVDADTNQGTAAQAEDRQAPEARRGATRWPGWVWLIPLAALIVGGWFIYKDWIVGSKEVTVHFAQAQGVSVDAPVLYKGIQVGHVNEIRLADDLEDVELKLVLKGPVSKHLGEQTSFWIVQPRLTSGDVRGLIAGAHLAVQPGGGPTAASFQGLETPPMPAINEPGRSFVLTTASADGLSRNAPVLFRGLEVGRVAGMRLNTSNEGVEVRVFVDKDHAGLVRKDTVFWQAGGVSVSTTAGISVHLPPLPTLLTGAVAFDTPERFTGPPAEADAVFALHDSHDSAEAAMKGTRFAYFVSFPKVVSGLSSGAPVELDGRRIGRIAHIGLEVDAASGAFTSPTEIEIDARALGVDVQNADSRKDLRRRLDQKLAALVHDGLRAKISSGGFLPGGKAVELVIVKGARPAELDRKHEPPAIPAVSPEGGEGG